MSQPNDYSIHLVGLGGTGANVIEAFFKHRNTHSFLSKPGIKVSCLAIDVADHDLSSLRKAYDKFADELEEKNVAADKVSFTAKAVKFPTPEAMFDFISGLPDFLKMEDVNVSANYRPWLSSSLDIPPLSGGVGRRRALSKAIYGLNYYYLKVIDGFADTFKEAVSSSTVQPVIFTVFGIGGGSGGGMAVDFVRHLRKKLGSSYPIIGLGILPCQGDDPPAKGASAYAALNELELLLDKNKNEIIKKSYGKIYANPFTGFIMMSLGPPYMKTGSLVDAKQLIDDAIVDVLLNSLRFDLSDLLNNIGTTPHLGDRWLNPLSCLKLTYPVDEHIDLIHLYVDRMDTFRPVRSDKNDICGAVDDEKPMGLNQLINYAYDDLIDIYKNLLIKRGTYEEGTFEQSIKNYIEEDKSLELDINVQIKGMEDSIQSMVKDLSDSTLSIGLEAAEGTPKARLHGLIESIVTETLGIYKNHKAYNEFSIAMEDDLNSAIAGTPNITLKQKMLLGDHIDLMKLVNSYLITLRKYSKTKSLATRLFKDLSKVEKDDATQKLFSTVRKIQNPELVVIFSILSGLFTSPKSELKTIDSHLSSIKSVKRILNDQLEHLKMERDGIEHRVRSQQNELTKVETDLNKSRGFVSNKKQINSQLDEIKHKGKLLEGELETIHDKLETTEKKIKEYVEIERRFEINSDYRKNLRKTIDLGSEYSKTFNNISKDRGYYDRIAELGDDERLRITQKILDEDEESLTRENMLDEIVDKGRLNEYLLATMRRLRLPSTLGLTSEYKTDYIWVTVVAPRGVWNPDLVSEMKAALSGYITGDASRCIIIREINSEDPWTIRFLVIAGRAKQEHLEIYQEMKSLYDSSSKGDKLLAHSFLLEHNVLATSESIKTLTPTNEQKSDELKRLEK